MQLFANLAYCDENSYCYIYKHFRFSISSRWVRCLIRLNFLGSCQIYCFKSWNFEDRNLVSALHRKIPGSDGKNIDFRFNYTPECMVSRMHFLKFFEEGSPSVSADFYNYPRSISGCAFYLGFALNSRALAPSIGWIGSGLLTPPPTEGD